ncbi:DUF4131 domain-containing protein, partial [Zavarzinia sp.]|uniref:DUF4131 domain-containing protein n=1 Tax=Zavarzinia sp. TaxID=2027920 RepID=UPI003BB49A5F
MKTALPRPAAVADLLVGMRDRWFLWLPVGIAAGIGLYFALPGEPGLVVSFAPAIVFIGAFMVSRRRPGLALALLALAVVALGFAAARLRAEMVGTPVLAQRLGPISFNAGIEAIEARPGERPRAVLGDLPTRAGGLVLPRRVRVTFDPDMAVARFFPGDRIRFTGILLPAPGPVLPGAPDYARNLWFDGIGAVGYATAAPEGLAGGAGGLDAWRQRAADG